MNVDLKNVNVLSLEPVSTSFKCQMRNSSGDDLALQHQSNGTEITKISVQCQPDIFLDPTPQIVNLGLPTPNSPELVNNNPITCDSVLER